MKLEIKLTKDEVCAFNIMSVLYKGEELKDKVEGGKGYTLTANNNQDGYTVTMTVSEIVILGVSTIMVKYHDRVDAIVSSVVSLGKSLACLTKDMTSDFKELMKKL